MRLQSLKLAGFKSFVDPVTLKFPDALTAIVGPNGCGKSNVIDAIRWVMGESSARQLRGEAMSDVIFAGSSARKPVGQASVELVFENTFGKLGGAYSSYTELSIRRQVTRDGRSDYFLNGTRCRRRDITDIFLGTGLGSRSYAVIGQGMINRLVEAKPDELRVFLEEAAGVSRYQARRRETQDHLEHTRLNLSRLHDVSETLAAQMRSLKRQSLAAERYYALQQEQRELQIAIWSSQYASLEQRQQQHTQVLTHQGHALQQIRSERHDTDRAWERVNQDIQQAMISAEQEQHTWQAAEHAFASMDAKRQQQQLRWQHLTQDQQQIDAQIDQAQAQLSTDQHIAAGLQQRLAALAFDHIDEQALIRDEQAVQALLLSVETQQAQHRSTEAALRRLDQEKQQIEHEQQLLQRDQERRRVQLAGWQQEQSRLALADLQAQLDELEWQMQHLQQTLADHEQALVQQQRNEQRCEEAYQTCRQQHDDQQQHMRAWQTECEARQALLPIVPQYSTDPTLIEQLQIAAEAQQLLAYLEVMYADWLQAKATDQPPLMGERCYQQALSDVSMPCQIAGTHPLHMWVHAPRLSLWQQVSVIDLLESALRVRHQLQQGQSLLTQDGYWVGVDWIINVQPNTPTATEGQGLLSQRAKIETLQMQIAALAPQLEQSTAQLAEYRAQQQAHAQQRQQLQQAQQAAQKQWQQVQIQRARIESLLQSRQQQASRLIEHMTQQQHEQADAEEQLQELYLSQASLVLKRQPLDAQWQETQTQIAAVNAQYLQAREQVSQQRQSQQRLQLELQTTQARLELLLQTMTRQQVQLETWQQSRIQMLREQEEVQAQLPLLQAAFDQALLQVTQARAHNQQRQHALQQHQASAQQLSSQRQQQEQHEQQLRDEMEQQRLAWQDCNTQIQHVLEKIVNIDATPQPVEMDQGQREERLMDVERQLSRLGELNLAAPKDLADVTARFEELAHQIQDLEATINQLEHAMQTIDQETRSLFMGTFDQVNAQLGQLFPKVFGGGHATLTLEDGWQSGVRLMAQPPGKKNTSIALLSGGEKALTALALVFAIFRLNPAPFCLLDEVDAPLDDANVQRFCHLVKELSEQVQFIYISHNKLAMMMAHDLLGVTMPEAGVSRLVSVNIEQAAAFGTQQES